MADNSAVNDFIFLLSTSSQNPLPWFKEPFARFVEIPYPKIWLKNFLQVIFPDDFD
jgi:hypothetical protein